jgi:hypothetical protein
LLGLALASRREAFNISANFLPRIRNSLDIKRAHRLIGFQNTLDHIIHGELQKKRTAIDAVQHSGPEPSIPSQIGTARPGAARKPAGRELAGRFKTGQ